MKRGMRTDLRQLVPEQCFGRRATIPRVSITQMHRMQQGVSASFSSFGGSHRRINARRIK